MLLKHNRFSFAVNQTQTKQLVYDIACHSSNNNSVTASTTTNSADVADLADSTAVLGQVLRAIEGTGDGWLAAWVNGRVTRAANGEIGESVELDVNGISGLALSDGLEFAGLESG